MSFNEAFEHMNTQLVDLLKEEQKKSFKEGVKFTITALQEAMDKSGLDYISPMWLNTIKREMNLA